MDKSISKPFFSVIIPTIGLEDGLENAIKSTIKQKFTDFEVIVVDNSQESISQETITSIVKDFNDDRVRYAFTDLYERSNARNRGIEKSHGRYICFLDEDDEFEEDHLSVLHYKIEEKQFPVAVFRTGMEYVNEKGKIVYRSIHCPQGDNPIVFFLDHMVGIHTLCFHHLIFDGIKFHPSYYYFEDTHLLMRVLMEYPFVQIPVHTCIYFKKDKTVEVNELLGMLENNIGCIEDLFSTHGERLGEHLNVKKWRKYMLQKKYLDYAFKMMLKNKKYSFSFFKSSLSMGLSLNLLKRYITYLYRYLIIK